MFFPHYIKVKRSDKVLDVGSGGYPYWRADVLCDKYDEGDAECKDHWGDAPIVKDRPFYRIIDGKLPFADKEFDLVTCACVLEHIETEKIPAFVKELSRVGKKVYIEVPKPFFDMTYNIGVHLSLCDIVDFGELVFIDKKNVNGLSYQNLFHRWMWKMRRENIFTVDNNPSVTAVGMMFEGEIPVSIWNKESYFWSLVNNNDYFCTPPTFLWKVFNRIRLPKKKHQWEVPYHLRHK